MSQVVHTGVHASNKTHPNSDIQKPLFE